VFGRCHHLTLPDRVSVATMANEPVGHDIVIISTFHSLIRHRGVGNAYPLRAPDNTSGLHRGSCYPVICVFLIHVIVLSFEFRLFLCLITWYLYIYTSYIHLYKYDGNTLNSMSVCLRCQVEILYTIAIRKYEYNLHLTNMLIIYHM